MFGLMDGPSLPTIKIILAAARLKLINNDGDFVNQKEGRKI